MSATKSRHSENTCTEEVSPSGELATYRKLIFKKQTLVPPPPRKAATDGRRMLQPREGLYKSFRYETKQRFPHHHFKSSFSFFFISELLVRTFPLFFPLTRFYTTSMDKPRASPPVSLDKSVRPARRGRKRPTHPTDSHFIFSPTAGIVNLLGVSLPSLPPHAH